MPSFSSDENLLFAVVALQQKAITSEQFFAAAAAWDRCQVYRHDPGLAPQSVGHARGRGAIPSAFEFGDHTTSQ